MVYNFGGGRGVGFQSASSDVQNSMYVRTVPLLARSGDGMIVGALLEQIVNPSPAPVFPLPPPPLSLPG
jgi:hypothetical protein